MQYVFSSRSSPLLSLRRRAQYGVGLIELMIGILIGMLVVATALLTFSSTRTSSLVVSDVTRLEQQANMTMDVIGQQIKQAGAMNLVPSFANSTEGGKVELDNFAALNGSDLSTRKVIVTGTDGASGAPDTLTITYSTPSNGGMSQNCAGANALTYPLTPASGTPPAATSQQVVSTLAVVNGNLTCGINGVAGSAQPLATNVVDFQVRYLTNNGVLASTQTATQIGGAWTGIDAVDVCLHITGESTQTAPAAPSFLDCAGNAIAADGRLHRVARNTFRLRNSAAL